MVGRGLTQDLGALLSSPDEWCFTCHLPAHPPGPWSALTKTRSPPLTPWRGPGYLERPGTRAAAPPESVGKASWLQPTPGVVSGLVSWRQMEESSGLSSPSNQLGQMSPTRALSCPREQPALEQPASLGLLSHYPNAPHHRGTTHPRADAPPFAQRLLGTSREKSYNSQKDFFFKHMSALVITWNASRLHVTHRKKCSLFF